MYYKSVSAIAGGGKTAVLLNTFSKGLARCSGSNWVFFPDPNWLCAPGANTCFQTIQLTDTFQGNVELDMECNDLFFGACKDTAAKFVYTFPDGREETLVIEY